MHQPGEGGQVGHVEVVGLVQHQVARQQAQHGRDLAAAAQAFGGGGEVIHGADQQRRGNQRRTCTSSVRRCSKGCWSLPSNSTLPASSAGLAGGRAAGFGLLLPVFEQRAAGGAAHLDGELLVVQPRSF
jgi:uncharacterized protein YcfJ